MRGWARFELAEDEVDAPAGTLVFVSPGTTRTAFAEEAGTAVLAIGATRGKPYEPSGWEIWAPAHALYEAGDYAGAVERARDVVEANPEYAAPAYNLACCRGAGRDDGGLDRAPARRHRCDPASATSRRKTPTSTRSWDDEVSASSSRATRSTRTGRTRYVASRSVRLSSPERVLFPDVGITKGNLFEYYRAIAPVLVPHLRNRPFTMKRSPYGVAGDAYFQKQAPKGMPSWIPTRTFRTYPREGGSRLVDFPLVNSPEALLWMVQMNCIDMNAWYSRVDKPDRPDFVLFDLDPPDGGFALAIRVAHLIREELERLDLESYVKTSGADGIHVLVPIVRRATFERTYAFAERVARGLEERHPGLVTTEWLKRKREGVLVDHRQNARGKTIASVYSVRPKPGAPVSTPLRWDELTEDLTPRRFGMREALERVEQHGDLFEPVLMGGQALGRALKLR